MLVAMHPSGAPRAPRAPAAPSLTVASRCVLVGRRVTVTGQGFSAGVPFELSIDGVSFGQSVTTAAGGLSAGFLPGGLGAGVAQLTDTVVASDGQVSASARFTVTRPTGALFGAGAGSSPRRAVPFEIWDLAPTGPPTPVFLHYVSPAGRATATVALGTTRGQCGELSTPPRALFPFTPGRGSWTLQFDTHRAFSATPAGRVARIRIAIS